MKSKEVLKAALHQLINGIEDEELLALLCDEILPAIIENHAAPFTEDDAADSGETAIPGLNEILAKPDTQDPVSSEEFRQMAEKWAAK